MRKKKQELEFLVRERACELIREVYEDMEDLEMTSVDEIPTVQYALCAILSATMKRAWDRDAMIGKDREEARELFYEAVVRTLKSMEDKP